MQMKIVRLAFFAVLIGGLLFTIGCKPANPDGRMDVSGYVTVNGEPIKDGTIAFVTEEATDQESGGSRGTIKDGEYHMTGKSGVKPGTYKVVVRGGCDYDSETGEPATEATPMERLVPVNLVPMLYGSKNTTPETFTVETGKKNKYDLKIEGEIELQTKDGFFEKK